MVFSSFFFIFSKYFVCPWNREECLFFYKLINRIDPTFLSSCRQQLWCAHIIIWGMLNLICARATFAGCQAFQEANPLSSIEQPLTAVWQCTKHIYHTNPMTAENWEKHDCLIVRLVCSVWSWLMGCEGGEAGQNPDRKRGRRGREKWNMMCNHKSFLR